MAVQPIPGATGAPDYGQPTPTQMPASNPVQPSKNISTTWSDWIGKPENRAGMIQAGLQMLQPINPGQTMGGHIAHGIGSGFEARDRNTKTRFDRDLELRKQADDEERTRIAQEEAVSNTTGLTANQRFMRWNEFLNKRAQAMADEKTFGDDSDGNFYTAEQIRGMIEQNPQMEQALWRQFLQVEGRIVPGAGTTTTRTTTNGAAVTGSPGSAVPAPEGMVVVAPDGRKLVKKNGAWVAVQ